MVSAMAAPGIPNGLLYGLSILGCFTRSIMNARHCMAYAMTAPNTAMERIVLPNAASGPPEKNMVNSLKPRRNNNAITTINWVAVFHFANLDVVITPPLCILLSRIAVTYMSRTIIGTISHQNNNFAIKLPLTRFSVFL